VAERTARCVVRRRDARLGGEERAARRRLGAEVRNDPDGSRELLGKRAEPFGEPPGHPGAAHDELRRCAREDLEAVTREERVQGRRSAKAAEP
jgi:hypothetical protein